MTIDANEAPLEGEFHSPGYPHHYGSNLQCIYTFIGRPNQRVQINFLRFSVKGVPPR